MPLVAENQKAKAVRSTGVIASKSRPASMNLARLSADSDSEVKQVVLMRELGRFRTARRRRGNGMDSRRAACLTGRSECEDARPPATVVGSHEISRAPRGLRTARGRAPLG